MDSNGSSAALRQDTDMDLTITERQLSDFPTVGSWSELLASAEDALLLLPREPLPPPCASRNWAKGAPLKPLNIKPVRPLNDLPQDHHYVLMLHDALLIPPGRGEIQPPLPGQPWRRHTGANLLLTSRHELIADSFAAGVSIPLDLERIAPARWRYRLTAKPDFLKQPCFYLEGIFGHYGHAIVEGLARLWPLLWPNGARLQDCLFVGFGSHQYNPLPIFLRDMLSALDISPDQVHILHRPTICKRLLVPERSAAFRSPHPSRATAKIWLRIGQQLTAHIEPTPNNRRLFLSRSRLKQNQAARHLPSEQSGRLDELFTELGYSVIHPQELPLAQQLTLVRHASFIVGCVGSQLHTLAFAADTPPNLLVIAPIFFADSVDRYIALPRGGAVDYYLVPYDLPTKQKRNKASWKLTEEDFERLPQIVRDWEATRDSLNQSTYPDVIGKSGLEIVSLNNTEVVDGKSILPKQQMSHSAKRLNQLAKINNASSYLEVGVAQGRTFIDVSAQIKTAVDIKFRFDVGLDQTPSERYFEMPSDEFFATLNREECFDLIFIDGKHTFEQTLRDLINSIFHSHERTLWLLDDTVPCDVYSALRNSAAAQRNRREAGVTINQNAWQGDVFKVVFAIHDFFPALSYRTVTSPGNPQTILWRQARKGFQPAFKSLEAISRLDYFQFKDHFSLFYPGEENEVFKELKMHRNTPSRNDIRDQEQEDHR